MEMDISCKQNKMLKHAYETVPFYMKLCSEKGIKDWAVKRWENLPIVEKESFVLKNDSFISAHYLPLYLQGKLIQDQTSGSTGQCANVYWNVADSKRSLLSLWLKRKRYYNINPHDRQCYFYTARNIGKTDTETEDRGFALGFCKSNLNDEKLIEIWKTMQEFKPVWLNLQPTMAIILGKVIQKYNLQCIPSLRYVETTGEMLFPEMRKFIKDTLNVVVADQYGCNEINSIAFECPKGNLHCMDDNVLVEIINDEGEEVLNGEEGEICITTLTNYAMPLIRYKVGDRGKITTQKCSCGNKSKILKLTSGRSNDWVIDGKGNYLNAYIFARCVENLNKIFEHAILQFQIVQHDIDDFTIHLVLDDEYDLEEICNCFMENLWQTSLMTAKFQFQQHQKLMPERETGKLKWFINEMNWEGK